MALTNAEKQARHRQRKAERVARMEAALREIVREADKFSTDTGLQYAAIIAEQAL